MVHDHHRILILTSDAGSGHRSAAQALEAALVQRYGNAAHVTIRNPIHHQHAPAVLRNAEGFYIDLVRYVPDVYDWLHEVTDQPLPVALVSQGVRQATHRALLDMLADTQPDVVVSVYPLFTALVAAAYRHSSARPGLVTVVTDLGAVHRFWFDRHDDLCVVPTLETRTKAINCGIDPARVVIAGIPVHPRFAAPRGSVSALRASLGWHATLPTVLLIGGGAGVGRIDAMARALDQSGLAIQLAIVAGRNHELARALRGRAWRIPTHIYDFVPLADLMIAADVIATKAGGLSVSEALAVGRPLMLYGAAPAQESGNLSYVVGHGAGVHVNDPESFVAHLAGWLQDPAALARAARAAQTLGRPHAASQIAELTWRIGSDRPRATLLGSRSGLSRRIAPWF
ncbi:MAG: galactosyldiacylglycerol synthase [Chloroflexi bacterium]|nr:galactosyldiacylglycerol synthase [Chloroflexota bacterium]